jgi:signal transduction histidine kinase/ActR/RegA family two-component response regulator
VAERWSEGDWAVRASIGTHDELGVLGRTFNHLTDRISDLVRDMKHEVVVSRAAEQAAQHELAERKRLEDQLRQAQKMEAVGRLAGGVAHDFNNLLTVIQGNVELARAELPPENPVRPYLDDLHQAAESAASLTRQLLAFSRRQIVQPQVISLNALVTRVSKMLGRLLGEDITLDLQLATDLGGVLADPGQFEQVLLNLAVNARDAMPAGGTLTIRTEDVCFGAGDPGLPPQLRPGSHVRLLVRDTGQGMDEAVRRQIFEPFFTTKPKGRGTGLGLATVFGAVSQAGGVIQVDSEPGKGTTFSILLPRVGEAPDASPGPRTAGQGGAERVLLVEDDPMVRDLALRFLRQLGYGVVVAAGGLEALATLESLREPIDVLFTDVVMPGMNGRELAERVAALRPAVKVLYTSGYAEDVIATHGVVDREVHFLVKPYSMQTLARKLRELLDGGGGRAAAPGASA